MYYRPDRPLIVRCSLDSWNKKITFSSARNCSYEVLRLKVEQCYSLSSTSFVIAYKDDDGEITTIAADSDLTEAIQYFQAGDDAPMSSAGSILSGRSFGSRKVTLRVQITVDYDGPSLSDTSSLISLEEYRGKNGSQQSFSFGSISVGADDDSVTVSSRDTSGPSIHPPHVTPTSLGCSDSSRFTMVSHPSSNSMKGREGSGVNGTSHTFDPFSDRHELSASQRYPEDPSAVFERLKLQEELGDDFSSVNTDSLARNHRGAAWLRDQNERTIRSMLGVLPEPSVSDDISVVRPTNEELGGDLALERDPRGRYYYTYKGTGSQTHESAFDDTLSGSSKALSNRGGPRPTSMQLNWLAAHRMETQKNVRIAKPNKSIPSIQTHNSDPLPSRNLSPNDNYSSHFIVDKELLQFLPPTVPPSGSLTDCSNCGTLLDAIRYVCSTCGEKHPAGHNLTKGKGRENDSPTHTYPPSFQYGPSSPQPPYHQGLSTSPATSLSSQTYVGSTESLSSRYRAPLLTVPSSPNLAVPGVPSVKGYELCSGCIESAGVHHAIEAGHASGSPPFLTTPNAAGDAASQWRRAPPKKGHLRHAFLEKVWSHNSWDDVEQDEAQISKCSTCQAITSHKRYKCASCPNINLCRACYSQVHELHPSHTFVNVPDKRVRSHSEPDYNSIPLPDPSDEQFLVHLGVHCAHCLLAIVGARFHCAICDSVDICANCESAGLPGNLDSADGGHNSSHILIKIPIPIPLETTELENASRRAIYLWTGRDAANVGLSAPRSKPSSVVSSYARTVVGSGSRCHQNTPDDHRMCCSDCARPIIGVRYQCANCPSLPRAYNLCADCELRSYIVHDPMHIFFKLPRPVQRPIESPEPMVSILYKMPVGPQGPMVDADAADPTAYLSKLKHQSSLCDRCMTIIVGAWFRCAYCARDLCDACEAVDTHDDTHLFLVFKSQVDMQALKKSLSLGLDYQDSPPIIPYPVYR